MATFFVIQKSLQPFIGPFISQDGRTCVTIKRAKQFKTQQDAEKFIQQPNLSQHVYLSPEDHKNQVWNSWRVRKVKVQYDITDC